MKEYGFERLVKATNYPPKTDREKAQWEWYRHFRQVDPDFDWKMPIDFYGLIIDETGSPIWGNVSKHDLDHFSRNSFKIVTD